MTHRISATSFSILTEVNWDFVDGDDDPDWKYLNEHATFSHREACEFIVHIGSDPEEEDSYAKNKMEHMRAQGCSDLLIEAYREAANHGAMRILFWA
jgi:hypothetical protein